MKLFRTLRNNWKKSVFFAGTLSYGTYYLLERKRNAALLQAYCFEALKYSREKVAPDHMLKRVTVFMNPMANKERGRFLYDKNVAPLLHLSGLDVRVVRLDKKTEASDYMKELDVTDTDCIVVAGGNATINECITGLMNRPDSGQFLQRIPIGVIPIGATNTFAKKWFDQLGLDSTDERELRFMADSAMSIIRGVTQPADLMKVSLVQDPGASQLVPPVDVEEEATDETNKKRGAFNLLKEDKLYALSNVSAGFVTETDAYLDKFWYYGWLKEHMNRYFMKRYLNRQPCRYDFAFKFKCSGCSKCLNESELRSQLESLIHKKDRREPSEKSSSFLQLLYRKLTKSNIFAVKETPAMVESRLKQKRAYETLIEKSRLSNDECNKRHEARLIQAQLIANINEPGDVDGSSAIETAVVKDPEFNVSDMFLAQRRSLREFELSKPVLDNPKLSLSKVEKSLKHFYCVEVDGEIYKLNNEPERHVTVRVEHLEKCINLLKYDPELSKSIQVNHRPKVYLATEQPDDMPPIRPFEKFYNKYWKPDDEQSASN